MFNPWLLAAAVFAMIGLLDETKSEKPKAKKAKEITPPVQPAPTVIENQQQKPAVKEKKKEKKPAALESPTDG